MASASTLLRPPPPSPALSPPCSSSFLKPQRIFSTLSPKTQSNSKHTTNTNTNTNTNTLSSHHHSNHSITKTASSTTTLFTSRSLSHPIKASVELEREAEIEDEDEDEDEDEEDFDGSDEEELEAVDTDEARLDKEGLHSLRVRTNGSALPSLTVKEKKDLASYAHSLGKKLKSQLVGKSGVNSNVATSFIETLEANELLKIKIHRTCPGELEDVVGQLEELTGSVVVGKIGRTVILYRPSLTKLKAEEKKRQYQKIFERRKLRARPAFQARGARPRFSGHGRRGSSRVSTP